MCPRLLTLFVTGSLALAAAAAEKPRAFSGIYPHLATFNNEAECGTGAVVPFAGRLWVISYGPHLPRGSFDKLYEIDEALNVVVRPESIGGTPANRMIHRESNQLFVGPYVIDERRNVRAIPYAKMPGRHTATMRHLTDPAGKVYYATMEEGFYEVDVKTLEVRELYPDANADKAGLAGKLLPGYHGKGAYTGQGVVVYANNGETGAEAQRRPDIPSGVLAEWDGKDWTVVRRNQFTEVTGPGGIYGNERPEADPIWSVGWDHRSLILMVRDAGTWHGYRLPKASHTYDGAHGWNTEWPRIREIGEDDLLMTMHGTFWRFPRTFSAQRSAGIAPRSTYLKVVGDFARWGDRVVLGCDDTAKSEFLNKRKAKGNLAGPGQSQSNLWFVEPAKLDQLGPATGRGAVWLKEAVKAGAPSDPFLFAGYERRAAHLVNGSADEVTFEFEVDVAGDGTWAALRKVTVGAGGYAWVEFAPEQKGAWVRAKADRDADAVTVLFHMSNADRRTRAADAMFEGLARASDPVALGGLVRARGENKRTLQLAAMELAGTEVRDVGSYELRADMVAAPMNDATAHDWLKKNATIPQSILSVDAASVIYVDDAGRRWRLPRGGGAAYDALTGAGLHRISREVTTERDLFHAHGTFYELPAENAGGFAKVRPVATHDRRIHDYCSYRGLLILTGVRPDAPAGEHVVRSADGRAALWAGVVDDLWKLGKPAGVGGPLKDTPVEPGVPSDPYLMNNFDARRVELSHDAAGPVKMRLEVDLTGDGLWVTYKEFDVPAGATVRHAFPAAFHACWARVSADRACKATAWFTYE